MDEPPYLARALMATEHVTLEPRRWLKQEFLEALAQELRAPLKAILGGSRLMENGQLGTEAQAAGETIARNARTLADIVETLIDLSAATRGRIRLEPEETDLCEIVEASLERLAPAALAKGVRLAKHLPRAGCLVFGDPHRLQQVVGHLLRNSIKFTPRGGQATVSVERVEAQCQILVADTGAGIEREWLPLVFDRFWHTDARDAHRTEGLGVGLALVKQLVELHGGRVSAMSGGLNCGATFTVTLPCVAPPSVPAEPRPEAPAAALCPPQALLAGLRVLIVDDEPDTLDLLRRVLGACQAQVAAAPSACAALAMLPTFEPQVLIFDVSMPGRDGYELIRAIRATMGPAQLPAAALSDQAGPADTLRALEAGFQVHLAKPIEPAELTRVIARLAGRAQTL